LHVWHIFALSGCYLHNHPTRYLQACPYVLQREEEIISGTPQNRKKIKTATDLRKQFCLAGVALRWWAAHEDWSGRVGKQGFRVIQYLRCVNVDSRSGTRIIGGSSGARRTDQTQTRPTVTIVELF
jgi:hypothetical protein